MNRTRIFYSKNIDQIVANDDDMATFVDDALQRHAFNDWGNVVPADKQKNDLAVYTGEQLFSLYHLPVKYKDNSFGKLGEREISIMIISEPTNKKGIREKIKVMFPTEY